MIRRNIENEVQRLAQEFPVVAILGPRQSGKTTLAKLIFTNFNYVSLEDPDQRDFAGSDPRGFFKRYNIHTIIDEIQRVPQLLSYLQTHVDSLNSEGIFVIAGSHNYLLMSGITQSLSGRVGICTLLPFSINEIQSYQKSFSLDKIIYTGSYPRIYDKNIRPTSFYKAYLQTFLERDIRLLKNITDFEKFSRFIRILAGRTGQVFNSATVAVECSISQNTVKAWLSVLETSYILFKLPPFHKNFNKRLIKSPKIYFYDTGLVCYLLGLRHEKELQNHYYRGHLFETLVVSELYKNNFNYGEQFNFFYWRDNHKNEVDVIIEEGVNLRAVEIKAGYTFHKDFLKGLVYWSQMTDTGLKKTFLLYAGDENYKRNEVNITSWQDVHGILFKE